MKLEIVDCFCSDNLNSGNRAAVIRGFEGDTQQKQTIAKILNLPVTVFLSCNSLLNVVLEYYYPNTEMPLCLHGTLAAAKVYFRENKNNEVEFTTLMEGYKLFIQRDINIIQIKVALQPTLSIQFKHEEIRNLLNLTNTEQFQTNLPFKVASVGSPKLLIPLSSCNLLAELKPNLDLIKAWSIEHQVNGLYVYAPLSMKRFYARGFNPRTGHAEDAATGVAAAALTGSLKRSLNVYQGENLGVPCNIITQYIDNEAIFIGGKAREVSNKKYLALLQNMG